MIRIHPFTALRPSFEDALEVSSDPYDVISTSEARERAAGKPKSFLHVVRDDVEKKLVQDPVLGLTRSKHCDQ